MVCSKKVGWGGCVFFCTPSLFSIFVIITNSKLYQLVSLLKSYLLTHWEFVLKLRAATSLMWQYVDTACLRSLQKIYSRMSSPKKKVRLGTGGCTHGLYYFLPCVTSPGGVPMWHRSILECRPLTLWHDSRFPRLEIWLYDTVSLDTGILCPV